MKENMRTVLFIVALTLIVPLIARSQAKIQKLAVSGYEGSVPVMQIEGRNYVEIESLVQLVSGSLSFSGNQITLTLPASSGNEAAVTKAGLSADFLRTGIEEISTIREWHSALALAIENQFPVTNIVLGPYETQATKNLRLAQVAAATEMDQRAAQMIANEYQKMKQLSDNYLAQRGAANYINANALTNDPLDQSVIACGRSLGAMVAGGQFIDDANCR